jgi:hypothetical protein
MLALLLEAELTSSTTKFKILFSLSVAEAIETVSLEIES